MSELKALVTEIRASPSKSEIIHHLNVQGSDWPANIAKALSKDRSTIHRHLLDLERVDIVRWEPGKLNGRIKIYFLTERGEAISKHVSK